MRRRNRPGVAGRLAALAEPSFGGPLPVRIRAWDGSEAGPPDAPVVLIRSRRALRRLLHSPGELGLAQAYVAGEIEVEGDLAEGLTRVWATIRERELAAPKMSPRQITAAVGVAMRLGALGPRPAPPQAQARLRGTPSSARRSRSVVAHHYDLGNDFYELVLDETMGYSCAYRSSQAPDYSLADAQRDKLDLVCQKLELGPGARLLDLGCGWGALALHAARCYGAEVVAVTLSREQRDFVLGRIAQHGMTSRVEVRLQDYRELTETGFDAIATLEMGEHVGAENYPGFASLLRRAVAPHGQVLVQQMSRRDRPGGGAFIENYIAPDMHMRPLGETVALLEDAGLEVRATQGMREHYAWTVRQWAENLEKNYASVVEVVGEEMARVWRLYLAGGAQVFAEGRMGVDQILCSPRRLGS